MLQAALQKYLVPGLPPSLLVDSAAMLPAGADVLALEEDIQVAIETCPVDCIHWVSQTYTQQHTQAV